MKVYSLFIFIICCIYRYAFVEIKPELKKNILKFGYSINYKYEGMPGHSIDRFYVVTKFILPAIEDLKFSTLNFNSNCKYLKEHDKEHTAEAKQHSLDLTTYCRKIRSRMYFLQTANKIPQ